MNKFDVAVIGGGAAGMVAAISARRKGASVVICEKMPRLGKKLLISGSGRCNLSNEKVDESYYNASGRSLVRSVLAKFGKDDILKFFKELGLEAYSEDGRIFPVTEQASSVLKVLEMELCRLSIATDLGFDAVRITTVGDGFLLESKGGKKINCSRLIMTGGGKSYPALGSDGSCYKLAERFGHRIVEPVPAAVPLVVKDRLCHLLQGQKLRANAKAFIHGKYIGEAGGELLFTKYGLSGTAILDVSEEVSIAINRDGKKDVWLSVDMVPFMDAKALKDELCGRAERKTAPEELLIGILPNRCVAALSDLCKKSRCDAVAAALKDMRFKVLGTRGWNEAEFTAGGIDTAEVKESSLESRLKKNLYFAGEIIDVTGRRGGYNLAWAWASGFVAGLTG